MSIDLSEFKNLSKPKPCIVGKWVPTLSDEEQAKFQAALQEPTITTSNIFRWAESKGGTFRLNAVMIHRRGACSCHRI